MRLPTAASQTQSNPVKPILPKSSRTKPGQTMDDPMNASSLPTEKFGIMSLTNIQEKHRQLPLPAQVGGKFVKGIIPEKLMNFSLWHCFTVPRGKDSANL
jgi:hypothetical protein